MPNTVPARSSDVLTYPALFRRVKETLLEGQRRVEAEKVRTYWETGRLIQEHIQQNEERPDYGGEVILRLAGGLSVSKDLLHRCTKFFQMYPEYEKVVARPQLSWTHFKKLITVPDGKERKRLEDAAQKSGWSSDELAERIKANRPQPEESDDSESVAVLTEQEETVLPQQTPLEPQRGELYTYRIVKRKILSPGVKSNLVVDLGFSCYRDADERITSLFAEDDIVESRPRDDIYRFYNTDRTDRELYTYQAFVEKVTDGDTLRVHVDLGFSTWMRQTLRLRGIDCPELGTKAGDAAKAFVQSILKETSLVVIRSSRSDKYDRYLADVFVPKFAESDPTTDVYLNNLLLEKGHAVRWVE